MLRFALLLTVSLVPALAASADEKLSRYEASEMHMGQKFALVLYATSDEAAEKASRKLFDRIRDLDRTLTDYNPDSELSRLCDTARPGKPVPVSEDLYQVLSASVKASKETDGLFDVTVGPVIQLWRNARRTKKLPTPEAIAEARSRVGYQHIVLRAEPRSVELTAEKIRIDVGGIGVGWALDDVGRELAKEGITRFLIDGSGDILCGDPPPDRPAWRIQVQPLLENGEQPVVLSIKNCAVTTSGDAYRFVEFGGVRYSHIVDPRTGMGLTERASVTVIARTAVVADSYAKAVNILGPEKGIDFIDRHDGLACSFVVLRDGAPKRVVSKQFAVYTEGGDANRPVQ